MHFTDLAFRSWYLVTIPYFSVLSQDITIFSFTSLIPGLMKSPSLKTSHFAGKKSKDLGLECISHFSSQADPNRISAISLCFAGREVSLSVLPKLLMEWLSAQQSSLEDSAHKVLAQPNKALGLVVRFSVSNYSEQKDVYSSQPGCSQTQPPSPSLLPGPCSQHTPLSRGSSRFTPLTEPQGEGRSTETRAVPHFCQLHFCIYQLDRYPHGWGMALIQSREWLLANAPNRYFKSASLLFRSCTVWPAVHEGHILTPLLTPPDLF